MVANHCVPAMAFDPRRARMPVIRRKGTVEATEKEYNFQIIIGLYLLSAVNRSGEYRP
jgi:hypothetical protein